ANVDQRPEWLVQFAYMGAAYMEAVHGVGRARVGLLSVGEEAKKGTEEVVDANRILSDGPLDFAGNVEGNDIARGELDVIVTDGFTGNVALKAVEGTATMVMRTVSDTVRSGTISSLGGLLIRKKVQRLRTSMSWWSSAKTPMAAPSPTTRPPSWAPWARSRTSWPCTSRRAPAKWPPPRVRAPGTTNTLDTLRSLLDELPEDLAAQAFTHASWVDRRTESYERLAFLGDVVLSLAISDHIFPRFENWGAGRRTKLRAQAVSRGACADVARVIRVPERLRAAAPPGVGKNAELLIESDRILASVCE